MTVLRTDREIITVENMNVSNVVVIVPSCFDTRVVGIYIPAHQNQSDRMVLAICLETAIAVSMI